MIVAVASGKGGTGKTTVAVALAQVAAESAERSVRILDCDVEAPDVALSLEPRWTAERVAGLPVPVVDPSRCDHCGDCAEACTYGALAVAGEQLLVFEALCHGCGRCVRRCSRGALYERRREMGRLAAGEAVTVGVAEGRLHVGESMPGPVIRQLKAWQLGGDLTILDAPPGAACPLVETLHGAHVVVLVTEPTPFGLHDLDRAYRTVAESFARPVIVVLNRDDGTDDSVQRYCDRQRIPLALKIPFDRRVAEAAADGIPLLTAVPTWRESFRTLLYRVESRSAA